MSMDLDFVLKLGGGAITHKYDFETAKLDELKEASVLLNKCYSAGLKFIVVHGAGSFGHFQAKQYAVDKGYVEKTESEASEVKKGYCKTRISVTKLNHMVVQALENEGLPAVSVSCNSSWQTSKKEVIKDGSNNVLELLENGFIPVLHGDCVLDTALGCSILSGDQISEVLSIKLKPHRVVFLSDVQGVYDRPPEEKGAVLLQEINILPNGLIEIPFETNKACHDVTGGILKKIEAAARVVQGSEGKISAFICAINSDSASQVLLDGKLDNLPGTKITYNHH